VFFIIPKNGVFGYMEKYRVVYASHNTGYFEDIVCIDSKFSCNDIFYDVERCFKNKEFITFHKEDSKAKSIRTDMILSLEQL